MLTLSFELSSNQVLGNDLYRTLIYGSEDSSHSRKLVNHINGLIRNWDQESRGLEGQLELGIWIKMNMGKFWTTQESTIDRSYTLDRSCQQIPLSLTINL